MLRISSISILILSLTSGAYGFQLNITTRLNNWQVLDRVNFSHVNVINDCFAGDYVTVRVEIPLTLDFNPTNDDMNIYFANDEKEILQTSLKKIISGSFFSLPYKLEKTMEGSEVQQDIKKDYLVLKVDFPKSWLPENSNKISASIQTVVGEIYNYYGIRNYDISMPDLWPNVRDLARSTIISRLMDDNPHSVNHPEGPASRHLFANLRRLVTEEYEDYNCDFN